MITLEDIKTMTKTMITPGEAAQIIGCSPQLIRIAAREKPELLGFPVIAVGTRTKIPRLPFLQFVEGKASTNEKESTE